MTSRVLGLVRDQVLAYFFGAGDAMDAFRIAFRIPNVLRDLFAEGAMSAALVPTFTPLARGRRQGGRLAPRIERHQRPAADRPASSWSRASLFAEPLVELYAGGFRDVPGKIELTIRLTRLMFPFLALVAMAAVADGDAERTAPFLRARALAGDVQRRDDCVRGGRRSVGAALGNRADRGDRRRHARRRRSGRSSCNGRRSAARDFGISRSSTRAIRGCARSAADGAWRRRARGGADQPVRQQLAGGRVWAPARCRGSTTRSG